MVLKFKVFFSKLFKTLDKLLPILILVYLAWQWGPVALRHFQMEGRGIPEVLVRTANGAPLDLAQIKQPKLLVFWATWCGPCTFELRRIQSLVDAGKIPREQVFAITMENDLNLVTNTVKERAYTFHVGLDTDGHLAHIFGVTGTPTIVVLGAHNEVKWITSGLSPSLEIRLPGYFNETSN